MVRINMKVTFDTVEIVKDHHCIDCGWPIIRAVVNWDIDKFPDSEYCDWWAYCSNKACEYHHGEDWWQTTPEFIVKDEKVEPTT